MTVFVLSKGGVNAFNWGGDNPDKVACIYNDNPAVYDEAEADWKGWWTTQAKTLHWFKEPTETVDDSNPPFYKWFSDGKLNASYNCLDRNLANGNANKTAIVFEADEPAAAAARRADERLYEAKRRGRGRVVGELTDDTRAAAAGTPGGPAGAAVADGPP